MGNAHVRYGKTITRCGMPGNHRDTCLLIADLPYWPLHVADSLLSAAMSCIDPLDGIRNIAIGRCTGIVSVRP